MNIQPYYVAITNFPDGSIAHACEPSSFADACDAFEYTMDTGDEAMVFRVEPPKGGAPGAMIDVTSDALYLIARHHNQNGYEFPYWLLSAMDEVAA